ncbi:hypothetical protein RYX36_036281 [Vicia faba]
MSPDDVLEYRLAEMKSSTERTEYSRCKIQMVANDLRYRNDFTSYYLPRVLSLGPIHHGNPKLQIGEEYKLIWAQKFLDKSSQDPKRLYKKITDKLETIKKLFDDNVLSSDHFPDNVLTSNTLLSFRSLDEKLTWMLLVDACSLLYIIDIENVIGMEERTMKLVSRDVLLLENQLPFMLLEMFGASGEGNWIESLRMFLGYNHVGGYRFKESTMSTDAIVNEWVKVLEERNDEKPTHLLDLLRISLLPFSSVDQVKRGKSISNSVVRYMNIQELKSNGIKIKSNKRCRLTEVSLSHGWLNGELMLPEIVLDDVTVSIFLNLLAYEMCPDFKNDYAIGTFLAFVNSLIRQPEDVRDLRSAGILRSNYGGDEELVKLFHFIATDVATNADIYSGVFGEINKHIANKWKTNTDHFLSYIRHPWTNFAVHASELALAFGIVQTWFTIHPAKSS